MSGRVSGRVSGRGEAPATLLCSVALVPYSCPLWQSTRWANHPHVHPPAHPPLAAHPPTHLRWSSTILCVTLMMWSPFQYLIRLRLSSVFTTSSAAGREGGGARQAAGRGGRVRRRRRRQAGLAVARLPRGGGQRSPCFTDQPLRLPSSPPSPPLPSPACHTCADGCLVADVLDGQGGLVLPQHLKDLPRPVAAVRHLQAAQAGRRYRRDSGTSRKCEMGAVGEQRCGG